MYLKITKLLKVTEYLTHTQDSPSVESTQEQGKALSY